MRTIYLHAISFWAEARYACVTRSYGGDNCLSTRAMATRSERVRACSCWAGPDWRATMALDVCQWNEQCRFWVGEDDGGQWVIRGGRRYGQWWILWGYGESEPRSTQKGNLPLQVEWSRLVSLTKVSLIIIIDKKSLIIQIKSLIKVSRKGGDLAFLNNESELGKWLNLKFEFKFLSTRFNFCLWRCNLFCNCETCSAIGAGI